VDVRLVPTQGVRVRDSVYNAIVEYPEAELFLTRLEARLAI